MKHDRESLTNALNATTETLSEFDTEIFRFSDSRLRYEIHLQSNSGTALLAADPAEPIQGCPMLEFSFRCTEKKGFTDLQITGNTRNPQVLEGAFFCLHTESTLWSTNLAETKFECDSNTINCNHFRS